MSDIYHKDMILKSRIEINEKEKDGNSGMLNIWIYTD